jgi:hypothetical protein
MIFILLDMTCSDPGPAVPVVSWPCVLTAVRLGDIFFTFMLFAGYLLLDDQLLGAVVPDYQLDLVSDLQ